MSRVPVLVAFTLIMAFGAQGAVKADEYPSRPVHMVVGYPPGAGVDFTARLWTQDIEKIPQPRSPEVLLEQSRLLASVPRKSRCENVIQAHHRRDDGCGEKTITRHCRGSGSSYRPACGVEAVLFIIIS